MIEANLGTPSIALELGDRIQFSIKGVYSGPGHIRSMRVDLDNQTVLITSYHQPDAPRATSSSSINDKARIVAKTRRG